jgi:hypothetical protein
LFPALRSLRFCGWSDILLGNIAKQKAHEITIPFLDMAPDLRVRLPADAAIQYTCNDYPANSNTYTPLDGI